MGARAQARTWAACMGECQCVRGMAGLEHVRISRDVVCAVSPVAHLYRAVCPSLCVCVACDASGGVGTGRSAGVGGAGRVPCGVHPCRARRKQARLRFYDIPTSTRYEYVRALASLRPQHLSRFLRKLGCRAITCDAFTCPHCEVRGSPVDSTALLGVDQRHRAVRVRNGLLILLEDDGITLLALLNTSECALPAAAAKRGGWAGLLRYEPLATVEEVLDEADEQSQHLARRKERQTE